MTEPLTPAQQHLLDWFAGAARDLPWRRTRDPYHILVSEMMLQQTQVERVLPKYAAFLAAFPTLQSLAEAPVAEVIRLWSGLGYNRRAVNLQRTAQVVVQNYGGSFPQQVEELRRLPGIGAYTAGALACFAFEQDVFFMDTNIRRVLRRWRFGPDEGEPVGDAAISAAGEQLVPQGLGWAWNQALMELGALICTAATPHCWRCPLRNDCRAYATRRVADETLFAAAYVPPPRQARRVAEVRREEPYAGSRRYYRGRIVALLRELPPGTTLTLNELGARLKPGYTIAEQNWLKELLTGLTRDGLVLIEDETARLP